MHHWIVPPTPPKMPWNMSLISAVESFIACPVDSITLDATSPKFSPTFSSKLPTPFNVLWIAPPIIFMMDLLPCTTDSKVAYRGLPIPSSVAQSPSSIWRSFSS